MHSAALLLFRRHAGAVEVLIGHMGGPFWRGKSVGAWSIPKGEYDPDTETALDAARREFTEELGIPVPDGDVHPLGEFRQGSGKRVTVFAIEADPDLSGVVFGEFELEWPPRSGRTASFPEIDDIAWCPVERAGELLVKGQRPALAALTARLRAAG